jgi:hypothetical protein
MNDICTEDFLVRIDELDRMQALLQEKASILFAIGRIYEDKALECGAEIKQFELLLSRWQETESIYGRSYV